MTSDQSSQASDRHTSVDDGYVVAVDIGNSAVKISWRSVYGDGLSDHSGTGDSGVLECDSVGDTLRKTVIAYTRDQWARESTDILQELFGSHPVQWRVASVNATRIKQLRQAIARHRPDDSVWVISHRDVPMPSLVDEPDRLGIDRLVGAWAASRRHSGPLAVVDAGSAVTVDWINAGGAFAGGAILPGLALQTSSLGSGTDALPEVDWDIRERFLVPATNTADAIRLGILGGVAGAIDRLVDWYRDQAVATMNGSGTGAASTAETPDSAVTSDVLPKKSDIAIVITGGDAHAICPHLRNRYDHAANLVCEGVMELPDSPLAKS